MRRSLSKRGGRLHGTSPPSCLRVRAVRARWLYALVFLAYLLGPAPAKHDPRAPTPLASLSAAPFLGLVETVYATAERADQVRWAGRVAGGFWTAAAVAATFAALRMVVSGTTALVLALFAGFASPLWSWASRSDTIEAPSTLVVALLLWLAVRDARDSAGAAAFAALASGALAAMLWLLDPALGVVTPLAILCVRALPWTRRAALVAGAGALATALVGWGRAAAPG